MEDFRFIESADTLLQFVIEHPEIRTPETVEKLHSEIVSGIVVDLGRAERLANLARWMAEILEDEYARGVADRCHGHVRYAASDYASALQSYQSAIRRFEVAGRERDLARTLAGSMQSLIYLGRYETALQYSERARAIFKRDSDNLRLARLDSNVGNILYRQDRYAEAHNFYQKAYDRLVALNYPKDAAAVLSNMAVATTGIGEFEKALEEYRKSREIAHGEGMTTLVAELDYNIAYVHFLAGDYSRAVSLYRDAREHSISVNDAYHAALCDLDLAEVYLDLNLIEESKFLARRAADSFKLLTMDYERAKALTFLAIGEHRSNNSRRSIVLFSRARSLFLQGHNTVWPAMTVLYRAILLHDLGQTEPALRVAQRARQAFVTEALPNRLAIADLFLARMLLDAGNTEGAFQAVTEATRELSEAAYPMVFFNAAYLKGQIRIRQGDARTAYTSFLDAARLLETVRSRLVGDELKIGFVHSKLEVYSILMLLAREHAPKAQRNAVMFDFIEKSKSRSLADRISAIDASQKQLETPSEFLRIRQELSVLYRELDNRQADRRDTHDIRRRIIAHEQQLKGIATEHAVHGTPLAGTADWTPVALDALVASLPKRVQIVEFFMASNHVWAVVIGSAGSYFHDLGDIAPIQRALAFFNFQIYKASRESGKGLDRTRRSATLAHLRELYALLIEPLESSLDADDLVIVPHGILHGLPFHALHDGSRFLIDRTTVSYAPSATIFCLCRRRICRTAKRSLVMGITSEKNPGIGEEIQAVSKLLPNPVIFLGHEATERALFERASECRYVHIASHGEFRRDNPIFSSIRLGDAHISVLDLYRLILDAELVTLSGCSTGAGAVASGDEMVGLARGLMHAGARSVLLTLWDVHDPSTACFMTWFYQNLTQGHSSATAFREAVLMLKQKWPEPYYWAPFTLSGYALAP